MRLFSLILGMIFLMSAVNADIYKWTDKQGNVHFSDKPHPDAVKVELPETQTFSSPPIPPAKKTLNIDADPIKYQVGFVEPQDEATIRNNQGYLSVILDVKPDLKSGDKVQVVFDGKALESQTTPAFALKDINRGSHTLVAQVINAQSEVLSSSETITIFMHRPRVGMVPGTRVR